MDVASLDVELLGLSSAAAASPRGADGTNSINDFMDEDLADALEASFAKGKLQQLVQEMIDKRSALEIDLQRQNEEYELRMQSAMERSLGTINKLEKTEVKARTLIDKVDKETARVQPLAKQVEHSLVELQALSNARAYAQSMILIKRLDATNEPTEEQIVKVCEALKDYRAFMAHLRQSDLRIAEVFAASIDRAAKARRTYLQNAIKDSLTKLRWPITASNTDLRANVENNQALQAALRSMISLQILYLDQHRTPYLDVTGEFEHELWAVKALSKPILQRFKYHFSGSRATNRIDKPDWYHQFILDAAKDHAGYLADVVQPVGEQCMPSGAYIDVVVHFVRFLVQGLHHHYAAIWPIVEQSNALICSTLDETITLHEQLRTLFGYRGGSTAWPSVPSFFSNDESRFIRWMSADLEYSRRRLQSIINADSAWNTIHDIINSHTAVEASLSQFAGKAAERAFLPECADMVLTLVDSVGSRGEALEEAHSRGLFFRMTQLPLLEDFVVALEQKTQSVDLQESVLANTFVEIPAVCEWCRALNAASHVDKTLASWEEGTRYIETSEAQHDLEGISSLDSNLAGQMLHDTAKGKTNALRGMMAGFLGRVRRSRQQQNNASGGNSKSQSSIAESISMFANQRSRYSTLVNTEAGRFIDLCVRHFVYLAKSYFRSVREGSMNGTQVPVQHPGWAEALEFLSKVLLETQKQLLPVVHQQVVSRIAMGINSSFQHELLDMSRFSGVGAQALARDAQSLFQLFSLFARRPGNRFFRAIKDRVRLLTLPSHAMQSLLKALRALSSEPKEAARLLEEGHGVATLSVNDVEFIAAVRSDLSHHK